MRERDKNSEEGEKNGKIWAMKQKRWKVSDRVMFSASEQPAQEKLKSIF